MAIIGVKNLTFGYNSEQTIFDDATLTLDTDWRTGLTGRNGRGKTTFLKLMAGLIQGGSAVLRPANAEYFPIHITDENALVSDIIDDYLPQSMHWRAIKEFNLLNISSDCLYMPYSLLSGGEKVKVALCILFAKENCFLLIDEPTNHLDFEGRKKVSEYLSTKKGFILVSHDRSFMDGCVDHIASINKSTITVQKGNLSSWLINKERDEIYQQAQNTKLKNEIRILEESAKRAGEWADKGYSDSTKNKGESGGMGYKEFHRKKAQKLSQAASNLQRRTEDALAQKQSLLQDVEGSFSIQIQPLSFSLDTPVISARKICLDYGDRTIFKDISFDIYSGDRASVQGKNGSGKTSLLRLMQICDDAQQQKKVSGTFCMQSGIVVSTVPQDTSFLSGTLADFVEKSCIDNNLFMSILFRLGVYKDELTKSLGSLSSGQKKKILLARSLSQKAHVYIWDEPLNFVDITARQQIQELILKYKPTLVFVEHDSFFVKSIATSSIML